MGQINFYAYFSAYGNGGYDPNDMNFPELDVNATGPRAGLPSRFRFRGPTGSVSPAPNPYTSS